MHRQAQNSEFLSGATLNLLGPVRLFNSAGEDVTPRSRKTRAVLVLLARSKTPVQRSKLTDLLWGDRGEEQAKASLRQALYELRRLAPAGYVAVERHSVGLGPTKLSTDLGVIEGLAQSGDGQALAEALTHADVPFFATLDGVTAELDDWLRHERATVAGAIIDQGLDVAELALRAGHPGVARKLANQLEVIDPLDERVVRLGLRGDLADGERSAAMRRYGRLAARLNDDLEIAPSQETQALLKQRAPLGAQSKPVAGATGDHERPKLPRAIIQLVVTLALIVAAITVYAVVRPSPVGATPTIAVLPFSESGRKQNYFASGVSDEVLNLLAHQTRLRVLGRISSEQIGERPDSLEVARRLGVTHLLDGTVRTDGKRLLVIATLTRVSDGAQLWSERYERAAGDIFAVQGGIATAVAARLSRSLAPAAQHGTSPAVYGLYLSARQLARERRETTLKEADRLLREALRQDPNYAPAYAELAQVVMLRSNHPTSYGATPIARAQAEAEPLARKAIALDPSLGEGYAALGFLSLSLDQRSEPYMRKAVELSPQRADFHRWHAETLMALDRYGEAITEFKRAVEIDPLWGLSYDHLVSALYNVGRQSEAKSYAKRFLVLSTDPRAKGLVVLAMQKLDLDLAGQLKTARALQRAYPGERQMRVNLAAVLAELGDRRSAAQLMSDDRLATASLTADWPKLAGAATDLGSGFWDQSKWWNAAALLIASGHSDALVRLYERDRPLERGGLRSDGNIAVPELVVALRMAGHNKEAGQLIGLIARRQARLPEKGLLGKQKLITAVVLASLAGDRETAIRRLDQWSRQSPLDLAQVPAMALRFETPFTWLANDPRFPAIEDRVRVAINLQRARAGLPAITHDAWISDPKTLLTKN